MEAEEVRLEPVTIQLRWSHQFQFAGYYAAKEKGFYAAEGLDVSLRGFDPREGRVAPVLAGKAQYGVGDPGLLKLRAEGKPVVVLAQIFQHSPAVLLTRRDSGILSPDGLLGKKVMLPVDDLGDAAVQTMLVQELGGLDKFTVVPHSYDPEALVEGKVDAVSAYRSNEPLRLKKRGVAVNIMDPRSYGIDFYGDNFFTTEKEIRDHPLRVEKMVRATRKGWEYALAHRDEIIDLIRQRHAPGLDLDQLRYEAKVVDQMIMPDLIAIGDVNPGRYRRIAKTYHRLALTREARIPAGFFYGRAEGTVVLTAEERAWLKAHPRITLGYTDAFEPEVIVDPDGTHRGILVDVLGKLNERLGTRIALRVLPIPELIDKARAKQVDGIPNLHRGYAAELGLLQTKVYTTNYPAVFARKGVSFNRPSDLAGKRVAIIDKVFFSEEIVKEYGQGATIQKVKDALAGLRSVNKGETDFFIGATLNDHLITKYQLTGIAPQFVFHNHPVPACMGVRPDWPVLVSILNKGLATFSREETEAIVRKWVHVPTRRSIELTAKERAWLAQNHKVRVRVVDFPPFMVVGPAGLGGMSVDYLKLIGERTGIQFAFTVETRPFSEALDDLKVPHGLDLIQCMTRTPERERSLSFSRSYISSPRVILTRTDGEFVGGLEDLVGRSVAVVRGTVVREQLAARYPGIRLRLHGSDEESMKAVAAGKADAYVGNLTLASHLVVAKGLGNLKVAAPTDLGDHVFSFGVRKDWPELSSIIDKGLDSITPEERASIRSRYMTVRYEHGITSADVLKWGSGIVAVAVVVLALFLGWNRLLARGVRVRTSELAESEERFRSTFEQAAVGVAHVALDGRFLRVNQQFCDFVGYTHDEMLARTFGDITYSEDLQADEASVRRLLEGEASSYSMEKRYIRKGGDTVWANLTASLVRKADGEPGWFVSVVEDISERKQAEELLQGYQERLKGLASELTLAEERERRRIAAELHDGIAQSLAFARIQLASAVKTVGEATVTGRLEETSGLLREAIEGIQGIVHDLSSPSMNEIGLAAAVSEWLEEQVEKRHGIATEFSDECEGMVLDEDVRAVLFRTVRELAINAVKYARAGKIAVRMSCSGGNLHISVEDDGVGFDPDAASQAVGRGGGFGLFSIRERMADLGGTLKIVSQPGKGCHVVVTVPPASEKQEGA